MRPIPRNDYSSPARSSASLYVDTVSRSFIEAINARSLSATEPPWTEHVASEFRVFLDPPATTAAGTGGLTLQQHLDRLARVAFREPAFAIEVLNLSVHVDVRNGWARSIMAIRVEGTGFFYEGMSIPEVTLMDFRTRREGQREEEEKEGEGEERWVCVRFTGIRGWDGL